MRCAQLCSALLRADSSCMHSNKATFQKHAADVGTMAPKPDVKKHASSLAHQKRHLGGGMALQQITGELTGRVHIANKQSICSDKARKLMVHIVLWRFKEHGFSKGCFSECLKGMFYKKASGNNFTSWASHRRGPFKHSARLEMKQASAPTPTFRTSLQLN